MSKPLTIKLEHGERIIAVVPEFCAGPGWSNAVVWVHIARNDGTLRSECIQPEDRTPQMHALFAIGAEVAASLKAAVPVKRSRA